MSARLTRSRLRSTMENFSLYLIEALHDPSVVDSFQKLFEKTNKKSHDAIAELQNTVVRLVNKISERDTEITQLKKDNQELREELDELQQYSRKPSIRVYGIPEKNNDDPDQLLLQLFNKRMKMTPPIELQDIEISHRIGRITNVGESSDPPPPRPIIARFASRRIKGAVMRQKKSCGGDVPLSEMLTWNLEMTRPTQMVAMARKMKMSPVMM